MLLAHFSVGRALARTWRNEPAQHPEQSDDQRHIDRHQETIEHFIRVEVGGRHVAHQRAQRRHNYRYQPNPERMQWFQDGIDDPSCLVDVARIKGLPQQHGGVRKDPGYRQGRRTGRRPLYPRDHRARPSSREARTSPANISSESRVEMLMSPNSLLLTMRMVSSRARGEAS